MFLVGVGGHRKEGVCRCEWDLASVLRELAVSEGDRHPC